MSNIHSLNNINLLYISNMTNKADGDIHRYAKMKLSVNMSYLSRAASQLVIHRMTEIKPSIIDNKLKLSTRMESSKKVNPDGIIFNILKSTR